jgi:DNA-binding CsgD family transcriptional regulator
MSLSSIIVSAPAFRDAYGRRSAMVEAERSMSPGSTEWTMPLYFTIVKYNSFHAILVISDTDLMRSAATTTLSEVFDLTAAESRLAVAIANGKDLESFSAERQLSKQTVRNQLKSIFLKTGTNRQAQLAVMLSNLIPKK